MGNPKTRARGEQGIAETLANLDLSGEDDAETAAHKAVHNMEDIEEAATPGIVIPPPRDAGEREDEGEEEEPSQEMTPLPPPAPLIPAPKQVRAEKPRKGGAPNAKLGILAKMAPGAAKVKVSKRRETGELDFVRDYTAHDVNRFSDYESFIKRYLEPTYGPGEYELVGVDDRNNESALGTVRLIEMPKHSAETGVVKLVESVLTRSEELNRQAMERLERGVKETQAGQQNPLELMKGVMEMTDILEQKAGGGKNDMLAMMMAQQQQNMQLLVTVLGAKKDEDPVLKTLLAKILEKEISGGSSGNLPPPPPPPPPSSLFEKLDIGAALSGVAAVVAAFGALGVGKKDNTEQTLFLELLKLQNQDRMSPKELIALLKNNEAPATDDFTSTVDKIAAIVNIAKNLDPGGSPQNSIWDVLAAAAGNRDLGAGISRLLGAKLSAQQPPAQPVLPAQAQKLQEFQQNLIKARDALLVERKKLDEEKRRFAAQVSGEVVETGANTTSESSSTTQTTGEEKNNASALPQLPPQTREFLDAIDKAPDETVRARVFVDFLLYFQSDESTKAFAETVIRNIREGNRAKALRNLHELFNMFVAEGIMTTTAAGATLKLLNTHAEEFEKVFAEVVLEGDNEVTRESLLAPASGASAQ
jgi:hypothetical protein